MKRLAVTLSAASAVLLLGAPQALASVTGEGLYGETNDRVITYAAFIVIAFFPLFILVMSLIQARLDKRKEARKAAAKPQGPAQDWAGGW